MVALHAVALFIVLLSPVVLFFSRPAGNGEARPILIEKIVYVIPFVIIGGLFSAFLSINGTPIAEWLIPAFVILAAAIIAPSVSSMRRLSIVVLFLCIALCVEGLWLRESGYTSSPELTLRSNGARSRAVLNSVRETTSRHQLVPEELPRPLNELLGRDVPNVESVEIVTEWHTFITGLLKIMTREQTIWVVGIDGDVPRLEARPSKQ